MFLYLAGLILILGSSQGENNGQGVPHPSGSGRSLSTVQSEHFIPLMLGDSSLSTGVAISNLGTSDAKIMFEAFKTDGTYHWDPVIWDGTGNPGPLKPGEQRAKLVWEIFGADPKTDRLGWLRLTSDSPDVRIVYQFVNSSVDRLDGMNSSGEAGPKLVFPWVLHSSEAYYGRNSETQISVVNPEADPVSVTLELRGSKAFVKASKDEVIPARSMLFKSVGELFPSIQNLTGYVLAASKDGSHGIIGCELIKIDGDDSAAFIVSNALFENLAASTLYSAQAAKGSGLSTDFRVLNPSNAVQTATLRVRGADGTLLANPQEVQIPHQGYFEANVGDLFELKEGDTGTLEVETGREGLVGSVLFGDPIRGYAAALPLQSEVMGGVVFPHIAYVKSKGKIPGLFTGLALHAPGNAIDGQIEILATDGSQTAVGPFSLGPGERTSKLVSQIIDLEEQAGGTIRITTGGEPVVVQELFGDTALHLMSAVPAFSNPGYKPPEVAATPFIVVDQFGYRPNSEKIAVIRDPKVGFDSGQSFTPGSTYQVINAVTGQKAYGAGPTPWSGGATDSSSGDKAWWFDFSAVRTPGEYYVLDVERQVRSAKFKIARNVYNEILKHAVRTFFYQRAGFPKEAKYAGTGWADGASHVGPLQDKNARLYNAQNDASTGRDLQGGWYDAGDYNKYTNWTTNYVVRLLRTYEENPDVFGDDYNIPESGNGIPDIVDEAKFGLDWIVRMQNDDGSVLSIVGLQGGSPPSSATGQSLYGSPSTSAALSSAATFAYSSKVFRALGMEDYADGLLDRAKSAWDWAAANPNVIFKNNDSASGTSGLGAGQQEINDEQRLMKKVEAACYLFEIMGETEYRDFFDANYEQARLIRWNYAFPFASDEQDMLLYYTTLQGTTQSVVNHIRTTYQNAISTGEDNLPAFNSERDPYLAYMKDYTWGSNHTKSSKGGMFVALKTYDFDSAQHSDAMRAAERYIHYIHGVNPLGMAYLSNMYDYGVENGVNEFYHSWFTNGSPLWDRVGTSTYGPAPGFLTGGPNPGYEWDGCCPSSCGSSGNNAMCQSEPLSPPKDQPDQKSYKDFNTSWPLNSWSVTENSCGYQTAYIRLLSKFVQ